MPTPEATLRPALAADADFLYEVHRASMRDYVSATWGWDEAFQRERFLAQLDRIELFRVIGFAGTDVGFVATEDNDDALLLMSIEILPEFQRRGLGTTIIRGIQERAARDKRRVVLRVLRVNPAHDLYVRLGFRPTGETSTHVNMEWQEEGP